MECPKIVKSQVFGQRVMAVLPLIALIIFTFFMFRLPDNSFPSNEEKISEFVLYFILGVINSAVLFIAAAKLSKGTAKSITLSRIISVIMLFSFPIGTIIGAIWLFRLNKQEFKDWIAYNNSTMNEYNIPEEN